MLEKDPTTLSKEVKKRRITKDSFIPSYKFTKAYCKSCANYKNCTKRTSLTSSAFFVNILLSSLMFVTDVIKEVFVTILNFIIIL